MAYLARPAYYKMCRVLAAQGMTPGGNSALAHLRTLWGISTAVHTAVMTRVEEEMQIDRLRGLQLGSAAGAAPPPPAGVLRLGERLEVYWKEEGVWKECLVTDYNEEMTDEHCLTYDIFTAEECFEWRSLSTLGADEIRWLGHDMTLLQRSLEAQVALATGGLPLEVEAAPSAAALAYAEAAHGLGPRAAKRRLVEIERMERLAKQLAACKHVLKAMKRHFSGFLFAQPVDPVAMRIPDYPTLITRPMDYATVAAKLAQHEYDNPMSFKADMELIYANCACYNGTISEAGQLGVAAAAAFSVAWERTGVEIMIMNEVLHRFNEEEETAALPHEGPVPLELEAALQAAIARSDRHTAPAMMAAAN